jgi:hypothetical protein
MHISATYTICRTHPIALGLATKIMLFATQFSPVAPSYAHISSSAPSACVAEEEEEHSATA